MWLEGCPVQRARGASAATGVWLLALTLTGCGAPDTEGPQILDLTPLEGPHSGELPLNLSVVDASSGLRAVESQLDDGAWEPVPPPYETLSQPLSLLELADGPHSLRVRAVDASWRRNTTQLQLDFLVDNTPPALRFAASPLAQGRTAVLFVETDADVVWVRAHLMDRTHELYEVEPGRHRALVGVPLRQEPGPVTLELEARDAAGNLTTRGVQLPVEAVDYPSGGRIRLSKRQVEARRDEDAKAQMRSERDAAYAHNQPEQRWQGRMLRPTVGRVSSPFGRYRSYSDGERSFHTGMDITNRRGTAVDASAAGEVLVAGWQHIFGNVVIVHHGQGVSTSYNHLQEVGVAIGDQVEAGQQLGRMGSTGQSTGPHLHWGLVVGGEAVDPQQWLEQDFGTEGLEFRPLE